jgi:hypothetical protein
MQTVQEVSAENQAVDSVEDSMQRKTGVEIVQSASLPSCFYKKFRAASFAIRDDRWTWAVRRAKRTLQ